MPKKPDLRELMESAANKKSGGKCHTCALKPDLRSAVEDAYRLKMTDYADMQWSAFERDVLKPLGYPFQGAALRRHMESCVAE